MSALGDMKTRLSRGARLGELRATITAAPDTLGCLNDLLQILWGLPGEVQIGLCIDTIREVITDADGDPGSSQRLLEILAELRSLASIPGEEAVVDDALVGSLPDLDAHPVLGAVVKSFWPLFDAVDDRAF